MDIDTGWGLHQTVGCFYRKHNPTSPVDSWRDIEQRRRDLGLIAISKTKNILKRQTTTRSRYYFWTLHAHWQDPMMRSATCESFDLRQRTAAEEDTANRWQSYLEFRKPESSDCPKLISASTRYGIDLPNPCEMSHHCCTC